MYKIRSLPKSGPHLKREGVTHHPIDSYRCLLKNQLFWCKKWETARHEKRPRAEVHALVPYLCTESNGGKTEDGRV